MKILSWNVNGIRAVHEKGFLEWMRKEDADIVCLQEIKAEEEKIPKELVSIPGYHAFFSSAERPGYSGVAVYTKERPERVERSIGFEQFDKEGRVLALSFSTFLLLNFYIPHGGRQKENLGYKFTSYDKLISLLSREAKNSVIAVGDFNIAHHEIDLARPKENQSSVMFTKEEREKLDAIESLGYRDSFRALYKEGGKYTWWPYWANARERNLGWRIDYAWLSKPLHHALTSASIHEAQKGSDHCPIEVVVDIDGKG
jgi:exodeoxyribonuclease-3